MNVSLPLQPIDHALSFLLGPLISVLCSSSVNALIPSPSEHSIATSAAPRPTLRASHSVACDRPVARREFVKALKANFTESMLFKLSALEFLIAKVLSSLPSAGNIALSLYGAWILRARGTRAGVDARSAPDYLHRRRVCAERTIPVAHHAPLTLFFPC